MIEAIRYKDGVYFFPACEIDNITFMQGISPDGDILDEHGEQYKIEKELRPIDFRFLA